MLTLIEEGMFENCRSLKKVDLPVTLVKIGARAFSGCTSLDKVLLPPSLRTLGCDAFLGCTALCALAIPKSLHEIEDYDAFSGCTSLREVVYEGDAEGYEYLMQKHPLVKGGGEVKVRFLGGKA